MIMRVSIAAIVSLIDPTLVFENPHGSRYYDYYVYMYMFTVRYIL